MFFKWCEYEFLFSIVGYKDLKRDSKFLEDKVFVVRLFVI